MRRNTGSVKFYRRWKAYKGGFGETSGELWIGQLDGFLQNVSRRLLSAFYARQQNVRAS